MDYDYEATTIEEFGKLLLSGDVYKGKNRSTGVPLVRRPSRKQRWNMPTI